MTNRVNYRTFAIGSHSNFVTENQFDRFDLYTKYYITEGAFQWRSTSSTKIP